MAQYINKSALVAEIERRKQEYEENYQKYGSPYDSVVRDEMDDILSYLSTLEVKEVDLKKERIEECPFRQVGCTIYDGHIFKCKGACSWVVDYPKLKELKTRKGE